jgi:sulfur carrier protein
MAKWSPDEAAMIEIQLNGEARRFDSPLTVAGLLEQTGFGQRRVAVEVNREIVPRSQHAGHALADGDRVEIVHALGGG